MLEKCWSWLDLGLLLNYLLTVFNARAERPQELMFILTSLHFSRCAIFVSCQNDKSRLNKVDLIYLVKICQKSLNSADRLRASSIDHCKWLYQASHSLSIDHFTNRSKNEHAAPPTIGISINTWTWKASPWIQSYFLKMWPKIVYMSGPGGFTMILNMVLELLFVSIPPSQNYASPELLNNQ